MNDNIERVREVFTQKSTRVDTNKEMSFIIHYLKNQKLD